MKRRIVPLFLIAVLTTGCGTMGNIFRRSGTATDAKTASLQALSTTTRTAKLLVTAAAALADAGVITEPQWRKIAAASVNAGNALQAWHDALQANKDATEYVAVVGQALAVLEALMPEPSGKRSSPAASVAPETFTPGMPVSLTELSSAIFQLSHPSLLRRAA